MASAPVTSAAEMMAGMCRYDCLAGAGPMHTLSSANLTCSAFESASECTATASMPSSRHARMTRNAISPRLAMRMRLNIVLPDFDLEQRLAVLDRLSVLDEDLHDRAFDLRLDLVHQLHGLDDAEHLALLDARADVDEGRRVGGRGA